MSATTPHVSLIDPRTGQPLPLRSHPGYYPGFHVLSQQAYWDEATRKIILARVHNIPPIRFFTPDEAELLAAVCDRVLPQDDRDHAHKIPILNFIDDRLFSDRLDGYRYDSMPTDQEAYRLGLRAIAEIAQHMFAHPFLELDAIHQELVLKTIHDGDPPAAHFVWQRMSPHRYWLLLASDIFGVYYAHPFAWDEIGFGGPAYPRGYMRLEHGEPEPWEVHEQRYEWSAPEGCPSAEFTHVGGMEEHRGSPGQGGTH